MKQILFLLGPSCAGKSFIGEFAAAQHDWLFLEIDMWGVDGIDHHDLRSQWDQYLIGQDHLPLVFDLRRPATTERKKGIVLSFPSGFTRSREQIERVAGDIRIRYLFGSPKHCIASFLRREALTGRGLPREWWIT